LNLFIAKNASPRQVSFHFSSKNATAVKSV
jgi:hypothetical protein